MVTIPVDSRLLKVLIKANSKEFNELDEFAEFLGVSTRTIRNYIKDINSIIIANKIAEIIQVKDLGYKILIHDKLKFNEIINQTGLQNSNLTILNTPEDRLMYIIEILINSNKIIKIDELADDINVGRTTLVNDLKKIEALFNIYDIKINRKQNSGMKLQGNELNIRLFILEYLCKGFINNSSINFISKLVNNEICEKVRISLVELFDSTRFDITDETLMEMLNYIMVMLIRINDNKFIISFEKKYEDVINNEEYDLAVRITKMLSKNFDCNLNEYETIFLTLPLIGRKASINLNNIIIAPGIKLLVEKIIKEINENLGVNIDHDNIIVKNFEYHLNFMINRLVFNIKTKNSFINDIKRIYPLPYEMAKIAARVIKETYSLNIADDEMGYMALYFGSYIEQDNHKTDIINKVALLCGTGLGSAQLLNIKLRKLLGKDVIINNFSDMKITKELLDQHDIVFTTVDINSDTETPIIRVNVLFDEEHLKKEIQKKISFKKYDVIHLEKNHPILNIITKEKHFFILEKDNYMDNLNFMLDELSKTGEVDEGFKDRIIERELKASTSYGNYVALPHAINYKGNRLSIAFGMLKKNILWGANEVKIIILLIIPTEENLDSDILIRAYEEVLKLGQNKQGVVNMSRVKNYNEFKNLLLKETII